MSSLASSSDVARLNRYNNVIVCRTLAAATADAAVVRSSAKTNNDQQHKSSKAASCLHVIARSALSRCHDDDISVSAKRKSARAASVSARRQFRRAYLHTGLPTLAVIGCVFAVVAFTVEANPLRANASALSAASSQETRQLKTNRSTTNLLSARQVAQTRRAVTALSESPTRKLISQGANASNQQRANKLPIAHRNDTNMNSSSNSAAQVQAGAARQIKRSAVNAASNNASHIVPPKRFRAATRASAPLPFNSSLTEASSMQPASTSASMFQPPRAGLEVASTSTNATISDSNNNNISGASDVNNNTISTVGEPTLQVYNAQASGDGQQSWRRNVNSVNGTIDLSQYEQNDVDRLYGDALLVYLKNFNE